MDLCFPMENLKYALQTLSSSAVAINTIFGVHGMESSFVEMPHEIPEGLTIFLLGAEKSGNNSLHVLAC